MTNRYNYRRRLHGRRVNTSIVPDSVRGIFKVGIDKQILSKKTKKFSQTTDELNHYEAFYEEEANQQLREQQWFDEEEIKLYLDENVELKNIIEGIVDDCIVYDTDHEFCDIEFNEKKFTFSDKMKETIRSEFNSTLSFLEFDKEQTAWMVFYSFMLIGRVAYENIYETQNRKDFDDKRNKIIKKIRLNESKLNEILPNGKNNMRDLSESNQIVAKTLIKENEKLSGLEKISENRLAFAKTLQGLEEDAVDGEEGFNDLEDELEDLNESQGSRNRKSKIRETVNLPKREVTDIPVKIIGMKRVNAYRIAKVDGVHEDGSIVLMYKTLDERGKYKYYPENSFGLIEWRNVSGNSKYNNSSYLDSLKRDYNLKRSLEESRVAWNIMVGQFRLKMVVPTGSKLGTKSKEAVAKLVGQYKEKVAIDSKSGQVTINGEADYKFGRNIALPSRSGNTTQIDSVSYNGVDLSKMEVVEYFEKRLQRNSTRPSNRFDGSNGGGSLILFKNDGIPHDEISYHKRCRRITSEFSRIIKNTVFINTVLLDPSLSLDNGFYNSIKIVFNTEGYFTLAKEYELEKAKMENYSIYERLQDANREPIFSPKFLMVNKLSIMTEEDWEINKNMLAKDKNPEL